MDITLRWDGPDSGMLAMLAIALHYYGGGWVPQPDIDGGLLLLSPETDRILQVRRGQSVRIRAGRDGGELSVS